MNTERVGTSQSSGGSRAGSHLSAHMFLGVEAGKNPGFASEVELQDDSSYFVCFVQFVDPFLGSKRIVNELHETHEGAECDFCGEAIVIRNPPQLTQQ